jgi:8-oxo-dGTP pyrophosphatase MutT (NUDIX family)
MSKSEENARRRAARPRDAATIVLYQMSRGRPCVLMGLRHSGHKFMPDNYVFPGGRVDRSDGYVPAASEMRKHVAERLSQSASPHRARALAMAAVRETFEETGLIIGTSAREMPKSMPANWQPFFDAGFAPALKDLEYICRAVTPPFRPIRFNARFFLSSGENLEGDLASSGELLHLEWMPLEKARELPTPGIQQIVLESLEHLIDPAGKVKRPKQVQVRRMLHGKRIQEFE